jgi:peroxiredoxin
MIKLKRFVLVAGIVVAPMVHAELNPSPSGLAPGVRAPLIDAVDLNGNRFNLNRNLKAGPVVIVFYRGHDFPCCDKFHRLGHNVGPAAKILGATLVAINIGDYNWNGVVARCNADFDAYINDETASIVTSYNVGYDVPHDMWQEMEKKKRKDLKDVEEPFGKSDHVLAMPAIFVVGRDGKVVYSHARLTQNNRATEADVIRAIETAASDYN